MAFGTYRLSFQDAYRMTKNAIIEGVNLIDTAQLYQNESAVQIAIDECDKIDKPVPLYVTSKVHSKYLKKTSIDGTVIASALRETISVLPSVSCMLLHYPEEGFVEAWRQLVMIKENDYPNIDIGVSNFAIQHLNAIEEAKLPIPLYNQIEVTPFNQCKKLVHYCQDKGIIITSHSCLTKGERFNDSTLQKIAEQNKYTPAKILIKWCMVKNIIPIYRTSSIEHLKENISAKTTQLSDLDLFVLDTLDDGYMTHPKYHLVKN